MVPVWGGFPNAIIGRFHGVNSNNPFVLLTAIVLDLRRQSTIHTPRTAWISREYGSSVNWSWVYERIELRYWEKLIAPFGADDWEFCRSALKALSQTLPFAFIVTAQNCLQEISSFDPSPETRSNRGMLIRHIANGIISQCRRVEAWFK